jgi:hypothetical protein
MEKQKIRTLELGFRKGERGESSTVERGHTRVLNKLK